MMIIAHFFTLAPSFATEEWFDSVQTPIKFPTRVSLGSGRQNLVLFRPSSNSFPVGSLDCLSPEPRSRDDEKRVRVDEGEELSMPLSRRAEPGRSPYLQQPVNSHNQQS